jgi:hypothetical protein
LTKHVNAVFAFAENKRKPVEAKRKVPKRSQNLTHEPMKINIFIDEKPKLNTARHMYLV